MRRFAMLMIAAVLALAACEGTNPLGSRDASAGSSNAVHNDTIPPASGATGGIMIGSGT